LNIIKINNTFVLTNIKALLFCKYKDRKQIYNIQQVTE
jgi:hypothetical protein